MLRPSTGEVFIFDEYRGANTGCTGTQFAYNMHRADEAWWERYRNSLEEVAKHLSGPNEPSPH